MGLATLDSYGYIGGQSFSPIATVTTITLAPKEGSSPVNVSRCFTATVIDQFSAPVAGVRVDFVITGANPTSSGFANTNISGVANFCYIGANEGTDNITAALGTLSNAGTAIWTPLITCPATITAGGLLMFCSGKSVTLTASIGTSYLWNNGASTRSIIVTIAGNYSVSVSNGTCTATSAAINVTVNNCNGTYCNAKGNCKDKGYIQKVRICRGIDNNSGWNNGYGNFLNLKATNRVGTCFGIAITPGYVKNVCNNPLLFTKVWVDWNQDGDFTDAGELIFAPLNASNLVRKGWIKIPARAKNRKYKDEGTDKFRCKEFIVRYIYFR